MALQTYDIDVDQLKRWWPNVGIEETGNPITTAVANDLINEACARIQVKVQAAGVDSSVITLVDHDAQYYTMRALVKKVIRPDLLNAAHHDTTQADTYDDWVQAAEDALLELAQYPERYLGALYKRHDSSVTTLGLDVSEDARDKRRKFDDVRFRKDGKYDTFRW